MSSQYVSGAAFFSRGFDTTMTKEDLLSQNQPRQVAALEQIVAYMTIGRDMSGLFNEVAALTSSSSLLTKRLVYLYLQRNSRVQPEKAVLQAGTFVKDTLHDSPLYRGAALRTMANLQISVIADFLTGPIRRCLEDTDPYVRRVAAYALVKQYTSAPSTVFEFSLLDKLKELLKDDNALVCAAAVETLCELNSLDAPGGLIKAIVQAKDHLLSKLAEGNEWTTQALLEGIALSYAATDEAVDAETFVRDGEAAMMKVLPYLSQANAATVASANKVASLFLRRAAAYPGLAEEQRTALERHIAPHVARSLISQLEAPRYELRYVALRNIEVFAQSRRMLPFLTEHLGTFLIKYNDPIYVKVEKVEMLVMLANETNARQVLSELVVSTRDEDAQLVTKSIHTIGQLATQLSSIAPQCVLELEALINTHVPHIVEDASVVVQNILRFYPGKFLDTIPILCEALTVCDEVEARAAVAWVVGEYTEQVPNAMEYMNIFLEDFIDQPAQVQYAVLSATAKMHARGVKDQAVAVRGLLEKLLGICTGSSFPDLRDRAYFYWRLLALDLATARRVLSTETQRIPPHLNASGADRKRQEAFLLGLGGLESVLRQPIKSILGERAVGGTCKYHHPGFSSSSSEDESGAEDDADARRTDARGADAGTASLSSPAGASPTAKLPMSPSASGATGYRVVLTPEEGSGLEVAMMWSQLGSKLVLNSRLSLVSDDDYAQHVCVTDLQLNRNMFGLGAQQVFPATNLEPGEKPTTVSLVVACNNEKRPVRDVQVALEFEPVGVRYFLAPPVPPSYLLLPATGCETADFLTWRNELPNAAWCMPPQVADVRCEPHRLTANALRVHCVNLVHKKALSDTANGGSSSEDDSLVGLFLYAETIARHRLLIELVIEKGVVAVLTVRCPYAPVAAFFGEYIQHCVASLKQA